MSTFLENIGITSSVQKRLQNREKTTSGDYSCPDGDNHQIKYYWSTVLNFSLVVRGECGEKL